MLSYWRSRPESDAGEGPAQDPLRVYKRSTAASSSSGSWPATPSRRRPTLMAISVRNAKVIQRFALRMAARLAQEAGR